MDSGRCLGEDRGQFGVVLVAGLPAVVGPVVQERHVGCLHGPRGRLGAPLRVREGVGELLHVQQRAGLGGLGSHQNAGQFRGPPDGRVEGLQVVHHAPAAGKDLADAELRVEACGRDPHPDGHGQHTDEVRRRPAGHARAKNPRHPLDPGQRARDRPGRPQLAAGLASPVDDRPSGRDQREHHDQAQSDSEPGDDAEVADHVDRGEQGGQEARDRGDGGQRERHGDVAQSRPDRLDHRLALDPLLAVVRHGLDRIVDREADHDDRHHRRERARRTYPAQRVRPEPALRPDDPDQREDQAHQCEQQIGQRPQEEHDQRRDQQQGHPDQLPHPCLDGIGVLVLDHDGREAADSQGAGRAGRQLVDRPLDVLDAGVARVGQADAGDGDGRAVRVAPAHRGQRASDLRDAEEGVDLGLGGRRGVDPAQGLDHKCGRDDRIGGCQQLRHARAGQDAVEEGVHLGEPSRGERFAAEHQRHHAHIAGLPEELVQFLHRGGDGAPRGKERY